MCSLVNIIFAHLLR